MLAGGSAPGFCENNMNFQNVLNEDKCELLTANKGFSSTRWEVNKLYSEEKDDDGGVQWKRKR